MSAEVSDAATRAAFARLRADARMVAVVDDLFLPDDARLGERTRLAVGRLLADAIDEIETNIRRQVARSLGVKGSTSADEALASGGVGQRLMRAGLLRDETLASTLIAHVRHRELAEALPVAVGEPDEASLLVRLAGLPDRVVASAARALLAADDSAALIFSTDVRERVVWAIAAAIRPPVDDPDVDGAIADAAHRVLSAGDEGEGADAAAMRLAAAIDARVDELAPLLLEALGDRRLSLFVAVLAQALGVDFARAQAWVLETEGERLWLALRAVRLDRPTIARIALALSDADPQRDIEAFADRLDAIASVEPEQARRALTADGLAPAFQAAIRALMRAERA